MEHYDYRDMPDPTGEQETPDAAGNLKAALDEYTAAGSIVIRPEKRTYFYKTILPVLKRFAFVNSAILDIIDTDSFAIAKITGEAIHIMREDAKFLEVFVYADGRDIITSCEHLPVLALHYRFTEYIAGEKRTE